MTDTVLTGVKRPRPPDVSSDADDSGDGTGQRIGLVPPPLD